MKHYCFAKYFITLSLVWALYLPILSLVNPPQIEALSGSDFKAGRIIDDGIFFDPNTMSAQDIQTFLNAKVPTCDTNGEKIYSGSTTRATYGTSRGNPPPYICLKDYSVNIEERGPDAYCSGGVSGGTKSAAQIIKDVSAACSVNPKVILVLLQKEQRLITDDWPWLVQYTKATGYGCPDSALGTDVDANQNGCYDAYEGFFNQIWYGARQYQRYAKEPQKFNYRSGQTSNVLYNPNASCGGTNVTMQNQATAGLYNYTPYQPNQAALNNLYGTGDGCSAYGNRNFWRMFIDWFGSPLSTVPYAWMYEGQQAFSDSAMTKPFTSVPTTAPGEKMYVRVKARNMGTQTWDRSFLHLGTSRPIDRISSFVEAGWVANNRAAKLIESSVGPGQIGTFEFALQAPNAPGTYNEHFNLVAEGRSWLNDVGLFFTVNVNNAIAPRNTINTSLNSNSALNQDDYLLSPDAQTVLILQRGGNLVLYSNFRVVWSTGHVNGNRLVMQGDGNLVLYNQNNVALWNSQTANNPGARLVLQSDGNMVIYSSSNIALWATNTLHNPDHLSYVNSNLPIGRMHPGQSIDTADRRFRLVLQSDGNLVLYSPNRATWATGTYGKSVSFLAMQSDGNLVLYDRNFQPLWHSRTAGYGEQGLLIQPDGNVVLYNRLGVPSWHTLTAGVL